MSYLQAPDVPPLSLLLLALPVFLVWWTFRRFQVGEERRLLLGCVRAAVQLSFCGFLLVPLFGLGDTPLALLILAFLCTLAALFSLRVLGRRIGGLWPLAIVSIAPAVILLTVFGTFLMRGVGVFESRVLIALGGMLAGNAMNALSLAGDRFLSALDERRGNVELRLLRGARAGDAVRPEIGVALKAAATPSLNGLFAVGLVTFPGMMTGQILAGSDPLLAARYQLMIMGLWTSAAVLCPALFLVLLARRRLRGDRVAGGFDGLRSEDFFQVKLDLLPLGDGPLAFDERPEIPSSHFEDPEE